MRLALHQCTHACCTCTRTLDRATRRLRAGLLAEHDLRTDRATCIDLAHLRDTWAMRCAARSPGTSLAERSHVKSACKAGMRSEPAHSLHSLLPTTYFAIRNVSASSVECPLDENLSETLVSVTFCYNYKQTTRARDRVFRHSGIHLGAANRGFREVS